MIANHVILARGSAGSSPVASVMKNYKEAYYNLYRAICQHHSRSQTLQDSCWENDNDLYKVAGLPPILGREGTEEDHKKGCDEYRKSIFSKSLSPL